MTTHKTKLADLESGYAISTLRLNGATHVIAAPEGKGPFILFPPPEWKPTILADGHGGVMSIVELPGHESTLAASGECYPGFQFENGGVFLLHPGEPQEEPEPRHSRHSARGSNRDRGGIAQAEVMWSVKRGFDLPFAHRLDTLSIKGRPYLISATSAAGKANKDDWSRPGTVYATRIPEQLDGIWEQVQILEGIFRNHGLHHTVLDGRETLLVGGAQGLIALLVPSEEGEPWERHTLLPREVSEVYAADLDEDGQMELVTIEPFHGNQLSVYKRSGDRIDGSWHRLFEADLSFGHGLWAGSLAGEPAVMAGSRTGDMDLSVFSIQSLVPFVAQRSVIERGAGPTQLLVLQENGQEHIFSVNQSLSEVAMYTVTQ